IVKTRVRPVISSTFSTPLEGERSTIWPFNDRNRLRGPTRAARPVESMNVTLVMSTTTLFSPLAEMAISASRTRPDVVMSISPVSTTVVGLVVSATSMRRLRPPSGTCPPVLAPPDCFRETARQLYADRFDVQVCEIEGVGTLVCVCAGAGPNGIDGTFRHAALLYSGIDEFLAAA